MKSRRLFSNVLFLGVFLFSMQAQAVPYCLALRGNGELAPAHWGALAQTVEKFGLPQAMAGGSSASISLFLLESMAENPAAQKDANVRVGLLFKSLQAYLEVLASRPEWREMTAMAQFFKDQNGGKELPMAKWLEQMAKASPEKLAELVRFNSPQIKASLRLAIEWGLVNPQTISPLLLALTESEYAGSAAAKEHAIRKVQFFSSEIYQSLVLFGKFNAETDQNLFLRPGILNFKLLAKSFGRVGSFYAGRGFTNDHRQKIEQFFIQCAPLSVGKTWSQIRQANPHCDQKFKELIVNYQLYVSSLKSEELARLRPRDEDFVGARIATFPSTAVIQDKSYLYAKNILGQYFTALDPLIGRHFRVKSEDVRFGYWGETRSLDKVSSYLQQNFSQDEKSRRFLALGSTTWQEVMRLSPAEPGLAPLQEFRTSSGQNYLSAGGWSDLHPVVVLKASGCENVVYVTRRGGESLFGQGVAKRLLGFENLSWEKISTQPDKKLASTVRNNNGDSQDLTSLWSRLYNLANSESSFRRALGLSGATVCTNWNNFSSTSAQGIEAMISEAYAAPLAVANADSELGRLIKSRGWRTVSAADNNVDAKLGYRPYVGCLP